MFLSQFPLTFHQTQSEMPYFRISIVQWEDILKLSASAAASEFCEWVQVETGVYIPHREY